MALARWLWLRARHRNLKGGLFFLGRDSWVEIGRQAQVEIGQHTRFLGRLTCSVHGRLTIGEFTHFSRDCQLSSMASITIGNNCGFAEGTAIHDMTHAFGAEWADTVFWDRPFWAQPIRIGNNVWVGCKSTIVGGVTIGDDVVVAANSVVTKDVPSHCLVGGAPAKVIRSWADEV